ncbi:MAG: hypothetical protein A2Z16_16825 [Chloroflexi bacterium RBG_16_54_18]|nr:MAG: hypothetical protein A2Z16_16825 [Chloroflexi bacterium RBG_16_54_18]
MTASLRKFSLLQVLILMIGAAWIWISKVPQDRINTVAPTVPFKGFSAPDFEVTTIKGETVKLSDFTGSPMIVNFWASWCSPCRAEMPALQRIYEEYRNSGLVVLAVNSTHQDNLPDIKNFIDEYSLLLPVLLDFDGTASNLYQVRALPTTFFIGADGKIQDVQVGGPLSEATIRVKVQDLLAGAGIK